MKPLELGLDTFGDVTTGLTQGQMLRNLVEQGVSGR